MKNIIIAIAIGIGLIASYGVLASSPAAAVADVWGDSCNGTGGICASKGDQFAPIMKNVINTILYIVGIIAVISIILGGINYITSNGDASKIASAKNTIMYSVVGLIVAIMSFAIVNFVVTNVK